MYTRWLNVLLAPTGGNFEWDDDFTSPEPSFLGKAASSVAASKVSPAGASRYFSPPPANRGGVESSWSSTASSYSRFSITPANIASFSLTHLTDSDIEQGGKTRASSPRHATHPYVVYILPNSLTWLSSKSIRHTPTYHATQSHRLT